MKSLAPAQVRIYEAAVRFFAEQGTTHASVTELAQAAGLARGTIYNNVANLDSLFEEVATALGDEMHARILASFEAMDDPALRLACGIRFFVRRAHEEPHWGRFIVRFAFTTSTHAGAAVRPSRARSRRRARPEGRYRFRGRTDAFGPRLRRLDDACGDVAGAGRRKDLARGGLGRSRIGAARDRGGGGGGARRSPRADLPPLPEACRRRAVAERTDRQEDAMSHVQRLGRM